MDLPLLFSGTSNQLLTQRVAEVLCWNLGSVEITRFIDNECRVRIITEARGKHVFVLQSLSQIADQHLVELCLMGQAARSIGASRVTAVIPWMGYSKQDKEFRKGEAVSALLMAKFIEIAGFDTVITVELHSESLVPFFHVPVVELTTHELLSDALQKETPLTNMLVVSPDRGGQSRSTRFAKSVGLSTVYLEKERDLVTGDVKVVYASHSVKSRGIIIFDDIINTGSTAIVASEFLKDHGAERIFFLATHPVLAGNASVALSNSPIDKVIVADTIYVPPEKISSKMTIVSVAPLLADAIRKAV